MMAKRWILPRWLADPNMTPAEKSEADELEHAIQHCLDTLPTDFRTVVVLADIQGMDYSEVATAAHVPLGTIRVALRVRVYDCVNVCAVLRNFYPHLSVLKGKVTHEKFP